MDDHSGITHSTAHYLLTIHKLYEAKKRSRLVDVAREMGIARSSATMAIRKLREKNFVDEDTNHNLILTSEAHDQVHEILSNRTLMFYFLKNILGVSKKNAEKDACYIEHLISSESQEKLFSFMKKITLCGENSPLGKIEMEINLSDYSGLADFKRNQEGDSYLST